MWVARNKNGNLMLHPFSFPIYNERTGKWSQGRGLHSCVIPNIYPDLKCEDDPIEVNICDVTLVEKYEELKDSYDALRMTHLSQVSIYKSLYEEEKKKNLGNVDSKE